MIFFLVVSLTFGDVPLLNQKFLMPSAEECNLVIEQMEEALHQGLNSSTFYSLSCEKAKLDIPAEFLPKQTAIG